MAIRMKRFPLHTPRSALLVLLGFLVVTVWFFTGGSIWEIQRAGKLKQDEIGIVQIEKGRREEVGVLENGLGGDDRLSDVENVNAIVNEGDGSEKTEPEGDEVTKTNTQPEDEPVEESKGKPEEKPVDEGEKSKETSEEKLEDNGVDEEDMGKDEEQSKVKPRDEVKDSQDKNGGKLTSEVKDREGKNDGNKKQEEKEAKTEEEAGIMPSFTWKLCPSQDYIPCLDNTEAINKLTSRSHFEHRERHCPKDEDSVSCLVPLPQNYKRPIPWPKSRDEVWYDNVPHPQLINYKKDQQWVTKSGERLLFSGHGTQFVLGADHYIKYVERSLEDIEWGKHTRVILDVGCGVASFGGYLFKKDVLAFSFAPKDEHEAQIQLALERGIPGISSVMGTQRLVFPANVFDLVHCARCRVPWHEDGGKLLLEVNRVLRPGGYFVWSAPPVYRKQPDQVQIWKSTSALAASMCWNQLARTEDAPSGVGLVIFQKPVENSCYKRRKVQVPPLCEDEDKRDAAWYVPMKNCIHKVPEAKSEHGTKWPGQWPQRLETPPSWLSNATKGIYGKPLYEEYVSDTQHWHHVVQKSYLKLKLDWSNIRNVMDMKAAYGGFAAALASKPVWVMNVVPIYEPDTLPIIFDRGLMGMYHDWCESFSTYPRTYDLLHADHLITKLTARCNVTHTIVEMDRILRPSGYIIFRDRVDNLTPLKLVMESLRWDVLVTHKQGAEELLVVQKQWWRPERR